MDDASPPKWHMAHTTWFFETFVLKPFLPGYQPFNDQFEYLFNSYYNGVGEPFPRVKRGHLSRPTVAQVFEYRAYVEAKVRELLAQDQVDTEQISERIVLGCHHEQQHQELLLTDLKYNFGNNPLSPIYVATDTSPSRQPGKLNFVAFDGGVKEIGCSGGNFSFDNEHPHHSVFLQPYKLAERLITNGEYLEFIEDDGYQRSDLWLSEGWSKVQQANWRQPLYWQKLDNAWYEYTLAGLKPLDLGAPVVHISGFEANAYASWANARLPTEQEFEWAACQTPNALQGTYLESHLFHPQSTQGTNEVGNNQGVLKQMFGDVWQWTSSSYSPYPGYQPLPGTLGEYNGKFMSSQLVLRGASCVTPKSHARASYRNFFYPPDQWQFSGLRLATNG